MDKEYSGIGILIFLLILFGLFGFGGGNGFFNRGGYNCGGYMPGAYGCNTTNCQVEKQGIIDSARTQYLVVDSARQVQDAANAGFAALGNKMDFYEWQKSQRELVEKDNEINRLKNELLLTTKFNVLDAKIEALSCSVAKRPPFYAAGGNPCASIYPTGCGNNGTLV